MAEEVITPPLAGGRGGVGARSVEHLRPGDWALSLSATPRRILRVIPRHYIGSMIGIRVGCCPTALWVTPTLYLLCKQRVLTYNKGRHWADAPSRNFARARELRAEMTIPERTLWRSLSSVQLGAKFRRQHPLEPYIVDFYAHEAGLVVEVDGDTHAGPEAEAYDTARGEYLTALGLDILRFSNAEVTHNLGAVIEAIALALATAQPADGPMLQWRRADTLRTTDTLLHGPGKVPAEIVELRLEPGDEAVHSLEVEAEHTVLTEICAAHDCGAMTAGGA